MSLYLKALGIHVYLATIKDSYVSDSKYIKANTKALYALRSSLDDVYLSRIANLDSAFVAWNTITSLGENEQYYAGRLGCWKGHFQRVLHGPRAVSYTHLTLPTIYSV